MRGIKIADIKNIPLKKINEGMQELIMVICGSVDSVKTKLLAVLSYPNLRTDPDKNLNKCLDDGNGSVRKIIMRFPHELSSGRTSSISYVPILFDKEYWPDLTLSRTIMATDLCGHEQYLKTTVTGICSSQSDFAIVCVDRIRDRINPMTQEHIKLLTSLNISFVVVLTKIDTQTEEEIKRTIKVLMGKMKGKKLFVVKNDKDVEIIKSMTATKNKWMPFFLVSCKTGFGISRLMKFMSKVDSLPDNYKKQSCQIFSIDSVFNVVGHGLVVSGHSGIDVQVGEKILIGPFTAKENKKIVQLAHFCEVTIRSIHDNYKNNIDKLSTGRRGCLCIRFAQKDLEFKKYINPGMIVVKSDKNVPSLSDKFKAYISVFVGHHTTIKDGFNAICNIGNIRASATFKLINTDVARSGDNIDVELKFQHAICIKLGSEFIFREGVSIGSGKITSVI